MPTPKVIISYSWTTPQYQEEVMAIADRLIQKGGVEVIIDDYDLKEGHDIVAYMERLKTDETLNHCLILSDSAYAKKADERKQGVGTEAQIISKEIYESIEQTRFIPIVMEVTDNGKPCLPTFLQNRKYIDFSSPERINQNWDKLIRLLHGKPGRVKPKIGPAPAFLDERNTGLFLQTGIALPRLRNYLMDGKPGVALLRDEVIQNFAEELNSALLLTANEEQKGSEGAQLIARWERRLKVPTEGRDLMVDWILMESKIDAERAVERCVIPLLETIYSMTLGPEGHPEREQISDVMKMLAYEMALYAVACIISVDNAIALRGLFQNPFLSPDPYRSRVATDLNNFFHHSKWAEAWNSSLNPGWLSPVAAKFKEGATHRHIPFHSLIEAEALVFVINTVKGGRWYPSSAAYCEHGPHFRWFAKAKHSTTPDRLALITGKQNWTEVRDDFVLKMQEYLKGGGWSVFRFGADEYVAAMGFQE